MHLAKVADESTIDASSLTEKKGYLTVYTDDFRAYESIKEYNAFGSEYVVHGDSGYTEDEVHVNICESHATVSLASNQGVCEDLLTRCLRFQI